MLASHQSAFGQSQEFLVERFSTVDGLPSNVVQHIIQDKYGFIWVGTDEGVVLHDAYAFNTFLPSVPGRSDSPGAVAGLVETRDGTVWIVTRDDGIRLHYFDRTTWQFKHSGIIVKTADLRSSRYWYGIVESLSSPGVLWIGVGRELVHVNTKSGTSETFPVDSDEPATGGFRIQAVAEDLDGRLWVGSRGIHRFDPDSGRWIRFLPDPESTVHDPSTANRISNSILSIVVNRGRNLTVSAYGGLFEFDRRKGVFSRRRLSRDWNPATSLHLSRSGILLLGIRSGKLFRSEPETGSFSLVEDLPPYISAILEDRSGLIWVGTDGGGLTKLDPYARKFHIAPGIAKVLLVDRDNVLWFGTHEEGLVSYDRSSGTKKHYLDDPADPTSLRGNVITDLFEASDGGLWIGTVPNGVNRFDKVTSTFRRFGEGLTVNAIVEDQDGFFWIATWGQGLQRLDPKTGRLKGFRHDAADPETLVVHCPPHS